ncbi:LysR family transcriptional regulator [Crossiella cryophila]|uniref:DNA-binding transcriptional LysR family regulator n=1 Tax=Crossiella cryophila TaxID=43355 RepID=A0A7W7CBJ2_9PSEU|nr:LysR family transcriptional regulator [Crossiella cryophila]MBB4676848.1 DNA-binding transcriptional LysR family regulator [Crossiella cryophila]
MRAELLDPIALRTFVSVVEHGSFTGAAAAGGYTQSAVSRQMAALEDLCGVELFARIPRGVRLTPAGEYLLPHARSLLDRLTDTARALDAMRTLDAGCLRVGAFASANAALLPGALARFRTAYPKITLTLREGTTERLLPLVEAGDLDLAVVSTHKRPSLDVPGAELLPVLEDPLLVALPVTHRLANRRRVPLAELAGESWIVADTPEALGALNATCASAGFTPDTPLRVAEWTAKLGLVAEGLGVTIVPGIAAGRTPAEVVLRPITPDPPRRAVCLAVPRHARRSPAVLAFHAELRASAAELRPAG